MKRILFLLSIILVISSCSSRKKKSESTFMKGFFSYYNTLFNGKEALKTELNNRNQAYKENYYAPYIPLFKYDEQPLGSNLDNNISLSNNEVASPSDNRQVKKGASILQIAESKALKTIENFSVQKKGVEKNKKIFDAYILLVQARLYQNKPLEALDAVNNIYSNLPKDKRIILAKIYEAQCYTKIKDYYHANQLFQEIKKNKKITKKYKKLLSVYYAEMLLNYGKKGEAVAELNDAFQLNKNHELRSRIAFLRGQILSELGKNEDARESFAKAYKYANNFEFEVKSQIEIAKTYNGNSGSYADAQKYLQNISKKGTYLSRKNEFYYAMGLMAKNAGKPKEADSLFKKSLKEKVSDPQIRGLVYSEIGKAFFDKSDYLSAGVFYDSALAVMTYEPAKKILNEQAKNIKQVSKNYYLIKKNDSILALTKMSESERIDYFTKYIEKIKAKEAAVELEKKRAEKSKGFDNGDYSANSIFANNSSGFQDFSESKGSFYFANLNTVAKGESTFKQLWGTRNLADNWRTSAKTSSIEDLKTEALGIESAPNPRRLEPSFYIEKIPTDEKTISALKKNRDTASLGLGRMYDAFFNDQPLATKTLYNLVDVNPDEETKLQALYLIFAMNYEKNTSSAERAKQMILQEFPYTSYAEFVKNPKSDKFSESSEEVVKAYTDAFNLYQKEKFEDSKKLIETALTKYPKDVMIPKFALLNAFNTGKTSGKEVMILQLEQIALNYAKTQEGIKAKEMLKYLKSDIKLEITDEQGNKVENKKNTEAIKENFRDRSPNSLASPSDLENGEGENEEFQQNNPPQKGKK